ncbi:MAG: HAD hydrolase-like protein [Daejeonella sp.]
MLEYKDLDPRKKAYVFEMDDVLFPESDYLLQVYYLFANFIEFSEGTPPSKDLIDLFRTTYKHHGDEGIFDRVKEGFGIDEKYRVNFERLYFSARLPLKLLLYIPVLKLLQEIIIDRKQIFIVTNGKAEIQLNKIRQTEWNGIENYLKVYFAGEIKLKPEPDVLSYIIQEHKLQRKDFVIVGASGIDEEFAISCGIDYVHVAEFL